MNTTHKNLLIVFDAGGCSPVYLQTAMELAVRAKTGIQAVYIEDNNLLNAAGLPFAREISLHTAAISRIDSALLLQKLRADANTVKNQTEEIAHTHNVSISFSTERGDRLQIIKNRAEELVMVLIPAAWSGTNRKREHESGRNVAIVYDDSGVSFDKALNTAVSQALINGGQLFVVTGNQQSKSHVQQLIAPSGCHAVYVTADVQNLEEVIAVLKNNSPGLVVLSEGTRLLDNERAIQKLINALESGVLLVR